MTQPLQIKQKLAGNPGGNPRFAVTVQATGGSIQVADPKATRALIALMDMGAVLGGAASHYGGPAAFADLMSALHGLVFSEAKKSNQAWYELFHVINDAGHCENGLYALKANYGMAGLDINSLKKFRSIESKLSGHGEAHLFPEGVFLSNGPLGSALPQSQGLAMADAMSGNKRVTVTALSDGASMEGEAREAFAAIPGFARLGKLAPYVLIISDNNTKLSGRIDKDCFSMGPSFKALTDLGWKVIELADGHDLQKCTDVIGAAIAEARANPQVPIAIHAKTIKGIGTRKTAESSSGGHGFPLKSPTELTEFLAEIYEGQPVPTEMTAWQNELIEWEKQIKAKPSLKPTVTEEKIQNGVANAMIKARKAGAPVISITSDLPGSTGVASFRKEFAADSVDVGVAESNMISVAAGFSRLGYVPVVDTFAQFGVTKGALPLTMASLSDAAMICIFSHTGFQDAADGASHQALSYLAMASSIPNVDTYCLTCSDEADALVTQAIEKFVEARKKGHEPRTSVFFLGRENFPKYFVQGATYELGKAQIVQDTTNGMSKNVTLVASGSMLPQAMLASQELLALKIGTIIINPSIHNHLDLKTLQVSLQKTNGLAVVVEDHQSIGGLADLMAGTLAKNGVACKMRSLAVNGEFGQSAYNAIDLYAKHGLDSKSIVKAAREIVG